VVRRSIPTVALPAQGVALPAQGVCDPGVTAGVLSPSKDGERRRAAVPGHEFPGVVAAVRDGFDIRSVSGRE